MTTPTLNTKSLPAVLKSGGSAPLSRVTAMANGAVLWSNLYVTVPFIPETNSTASPTRMRPEAQALVSRLLTTSSPHCFQLTCCPAARRKDGFWDHPAPGRPNQDPDDVLANPARCQVQGRDVFSKLRTRSLRQPQRSVQERLCKKHHPLSMTPEKSVHRTSVGVPACTFSVSLTYVKEASFQNGVINIQDLTKLGQVTSTTSYYLGLLLQL